MRLRAAAKARPEKGRGQGMPVGIPAMVTES
jgi:hypothetical protein